MTPLTAQQRELVEAHVGLVKNVAWKLAKLCGRPQDYEQNISLGWLGLIDAAQRWREGSGMFRAYARIRIRGEILDELRAGRSTTMGMRRRNPQTFEPIPHSACSDRPSPDEQAAERDEVETLLAKLPERDRGILRAYHFEELTQRELGEIHGLCEARISQIIRRAYRVMAR